MEFDFRRFRNRIRRRLGSAVDAFTSLMAALGLRNRGFGSQRVCPFCGLITPRSKRLCMECGNRSTV
jgi:hypothetical protein